MAYTEFRKSYGDFEIVVPAIDFSELNGDEAEQAIKVLRNYDYGYSYVCLYLASFDHKIKVRKESKAKTAIEAKIGKGDWGLQEYLWESMDKLNWEAPFKMQTFNPANPGGYILRKEWCNHMANEIEHEHFGHANQTT